MSKERELLVKAWNLLIYLMGGKIGDGISSINRKFLYELKEYISQPEQPEQTEQEPEPLLAETKIEWYGKGFRQGVNEFAPPKPLTEDVIYALDKEGVVENMDDHQVRYVIRWIRRVEKAHGIGGGE